MDFNYKFFITIEGKYFYAIDRMTGMVLASTCVENRAWFKQVQAYNFKKMLEEAGFKDIVVHDGQQYLEDLKQMFYSGRITQRHLISKHYEYREEFRSYAT